METEIKRSNRTIPKTLILISAIWSIGVVALFFLQAMEIISPFSGTSRVFTSGIFQYRLTPMGFLMRLLPNTAYLVVMFILVGIHVTIWHSIYSRIYIAIAATVVLLVLSVLSALTVGMFLLPSVVLLGIGISISIQRRKYSTA